MLHENLLFHCFLVNLIHTYTESSKKTNFFGEIFNSHENTACFVFIMRILFDHKYDKYLGASGLVLVSMSNGTIRPLFVCTEANDGSGLRAAATYHPNEGVSVK